MPKSSGFDTSLPSQGRMRAAVSPKSMPSRRVGHRWCSRKDWRRNCGPFRAGLDLGLPPQVLLGASHGESKKNLLCTFNALHILFPEGTERFGSRPVQLNRGYFCKKGLLWLAAQDTGTTIVLQFIDDGIVQERYVTHSRLCRARPSGDLGSANTTWLGAPLPSLIKTTRTHT